LGRSITPLTYFGSFPRDECYHSAPIGDVSASGRE
jgi:hypothetical protein